MTPAHPHPIPLMAENPQSAYTAMRVAIWIQYNKISQQILRAFLSMSFDWYLKMENHERELVFFLKIYQGRS